MSVELPKDANGCEIPLDTEVLYRKDGTLVDVDEFNFSTGYSDPEYKWTVKLMNCAVFFTKKMFLNPPEPPDSWENLLDDLSKAGDARYYEACAYFHRDKDEDGCASCPGGEDGCARIAMRDIASRIRKLRGED